MIILHSFLPSGRRSSPFSFSFLLGDDRAGDTTDPAFHFRFFALVYSFTMAEVGNLGHQSTRPTPCTYSQHRCLCTDFHVLQRRRNRLSKNLNESIYIMPKSREVRRKRPRQPRPLLRTRCSHRKHAVSIGRDVANHKRDLSRFVKWPKYIRLQP